MSVPTAEFTHNGSPDRRITERAKALLALLLVTAAICVWRQQATLLFSPAPKPHAAATPYFWIKNEQTWLIGEVCRQIYEPLAVVSGKFEPNRVVPIEPRAAVFEKKVHYQLKASLRDAPPMELQFEPQEYFWSPEMFAPVVRAFASALKVNLAPGESQVDPDYPARLTSPRPEVLINEDRRISAGLTKTPLDPGLHEEAALLVGSLALREATLDFMDTRPALNAMSAHLALAHASRGHLSPIGELGEALLFSLAGRQSAALDLVTRLQQRAGAPGELPLEIATRWERTLHIYNTGDYRLLAQPEHATLLEQLEYFRALRYRIDSAAAATFATKYPLERLAEWSSRIMAGRISVEDGNRWGERALQTEIDECARAYRIYKGQPLRPADVTTALNTPWQPITRSENGETKYEVLGWGAWAQFHQREICELIGQTYNWLNNKLGLENDAQQFQQQVTRDFGAARLFPLICFNTKDSTLSLDAVRDLIIAHPELVPYERWLTYSQPLMAALRYQPQKFKALIPIQSWFYPPFPPGTAYDSQQRAEDGQILGMTVTELEGLKRIAPYDRRILQAHLQRTTNFHPTREQTIAEFNELSAYDVEAMRQIAASVIDDPDHYQRVYGLICQYQPDSYIDLGNYLREHDDEAGAATAFQKAIDHAPDRVWVSNNCDWLINYYLDHGKKDEAFRVAREAAGVYSAGGLLALANLLERTGDLAQAEEYFSKIDKRYPGQNDLPGFYLRNRSHSAAYEAAAQEALAKFFPNDLEVVQLADFSNAPRDGVVLRETSEVSKKLGLEVGDVLVAIDGYRIRNRTQYYLVRGLKTDPSIRYIAWTKDHYIEVAGEVWLRRLDVTIADYSAP